MTAISNQDRSVRNLPLAIVDTLIIFASCVVFPQRSAIGDDAKVFTTEPTFSLSETAPLTGTLTFSPAHDCRTRVVIDDGERSWKHTESSAASQTAEVDILGLKPGTQHTIQIELLNEEVTVATRTLNVETAPLPDDIPTMRLTESQPEKMEPGVTLMTVLRWDDDSASKVYGLFLMVDPAGEIVWYYKVPFPVGAVRLLDNGHLMFLHGTRPMGLMEIDLLGRVIRDYQATRIDSDLREGAIPVDTDTFHHDFDILPNGNFLLISSEVRRIDRFPTNDRTPTRNLEPAHVVGDVILEVAPDGEVLKRWPLLDMIDPQRVVYGSLSSYWDARAYNHVRGGTRDWSHSNSLFYDATDDTFVVCLRHQDAVLKVDRISSEVVWILGDPAGWKGQLAAKILQPKSRKPWSYHAHGVKYTPQHTLLLFDNGNARAIPPEKPMPGVRSFSRAVEYRIDDQARTVEQIWSHGGPGKDRYFSAFVGDADWLPQTGNVLITDGGRVANSSGVPLAGPPGDAQWARVLEVTRDDPSETVFEYWLDDRKTRPELGWSVYRAERIPDVIRLPQARTP